MKLCRNVGIRNRIGLQWNFTEDLKIPDHFNKSILLLSDQDIYQRQKFAQVLRQLLDPHRRIQNALSDSMVCEGHPCAVKMGCAFIRSKFDPTTVLRSILQTSMSENSPTCRLSVRRARIREYGVPSVSVILRLHSNKPMNHRKCGQKKLSVMEIIYILGYKLPLTGSESPPTSSQNRVNKSTIFIELSQSIPIEVTRSNSAWL